MNLHKIANGAISRINKNTTAIVREFAGEAIEYGGHRLPTYLPERQVVLQLQPLTRGDLQHLDGLNLQGLYKSIHINDNYYSVQRKLKKGGDLFIIDNITWLVIQPLELWGSWSRLLVVMQTDTSMPRIEYQNETSVHSRPYSK